MLWNGTWEIVLLYVLSPNINSVVILVTTSERASNIAYSENMNHICKIGCFPFAYFYFIDWVSHSFWELNLQMQMLRMSPMELTWKQIWKKYTYGNNKPMQLNQIAWRKTSLNQDWGITYKSLKTHMKRSTDAQHTTATTQSSMNQHDRETKQMTTVNPNSSKSYLLLSMQKKPIAPTIQKPSQTKEKGYHMVQLEITVLTKSSQTRIPSWERKNIRKISRS